MFEIKHEMINTNTDNHPSNNSGMELETLDHKSQQNEADFSIDPKKGKSRGYCRPNEVEKVKILKFIQEDYDSLYGEDMKIINGRPNREQIEVWNRVFQLCRGYVIFSYYKYLDVCLALVVIPIPKQINDIKILKTICEFMVCLLLL